MIFLALIIFIIINLSTKWILKKKFPQLGVNFKWKIPFLKLTGLLIIFLLAFILIFSVTMTSEKKYIVNKNAIYGLKFSKTMNSFGFQDNMKVISINDKEIDRVSDIFKKIILANDDTIIVVEQNGIKDKIILDYSDKNLLIEDQTLNAIVPILYDSSGENKILISAKKNQFTDVIFMFKNLWKQSVKLINPTSIAYKGTGGFISFSRINSFRGYLILLSFSFIMIGIINMLPFPGFSFGNFIISSIETLRKKTFNKIRLRMAKITSIILIIIYSILLAL
jgi:hypothetical protein|tara:strand:+ start:28 stop:867 length:840 start_codon:yes stop_codon:yes gene_type:complete